MSSRVAWASRIRSQGIPVLPVEAGSVHEMGRSEDQLVDARVPGGFQQEHRFRSHPSTSRLEQQLVQAHRL